MELEYSYTWRKSQNGSIGIQNKAPETAVLENGYRLEDIFVDLYLNMQQARNNCFE